MIHLIANKSILQANNAQFGVKYQPEYDSNAKTDLPDFVDDLKKNLEEASKSASNGEETQNGVGTPGDLSIINFKKQNEPDHSSVLIGSQKELKSFTPQPRHYYLSQKEIKENFAYYFLPNGYPQSVSEGYAKFSLLFSISAFSIT